MRNFYRNLTFNYNFYFLFHFHLEKMVLPKLVLQHWRSIISRVRSTTSHALSDLFLIAIPWSIIIMPILQKNWGTKETPTMMNYQVPFKKFKRIGEEKKGAAREEERFFMQCYSMLSRYKENITWGEKFSSFFCKCVAHCLMILVD